MQDGILTERNGAILEVTIDRPKANAIDLAASRRLNDVFTQFRDDASLRVAIITGAGDRFFSPGWDLKAAAAGEESDSDWGAGGFGGLNYPRNLNKPIIAAVNGIACGGGFEIVLGTDIIVMEEHARFALPEINVAVLADAGTIKLRRRIPYHVAVEFLMTGRWMDAAEAKHWGLANHVVPKGQGLAKAREIAQPAGRRTAAAVPGHQAAAAAHGNGARARSLRAARLAAPGAAGRALGGPQGRHAGLRREAQAALDRPLAGAAPRRRRRGCRVQPPSGRSSAREMMWRCTSLVPSQMRSMRASRQMRSSGSSVIRPMPPWICSASSATIASISVAFSLAMAMSMSVAVPWSRFHAASSTSSSAARSSTAMSASLKLTPWKRPIG